MQQLLSEALKALGSSRKKPTYIETSRADWDALRDRVSMIDMFVRGMAVKNLPLGESIPLHRLIKAGHIHRYEQLCLLFVSMIDYIIIPNELFPLYGLVLG